MLSMSSMVHGSGRDARCEAPDLHHSHSLLYSRVQPRTQPQPYTQYPATPVSHHYSNSNSSSNTQSLDYAYHNSNAQSPPSPPGDDINKPSLPSISSLLGIADGERSTAESSPKSQQTPQPQPQQQQANSQPQQLTIIPQTSDYRHDASSQIFSPAALSDSRMTLPPTPPMRPDSTVDGQHSPSTISTGSSISAPPYYLGQALNNLDPATQRTHTVPSAMPIKRQQSLPSQPQISPYGTSPYSTSPYASSPGAMSASGFYSPENVLPSSGLYSQRPLPSNFPPPVQIPITSNGGGSTNPWQHHHYISASSQASFPQSQDRYICQTCNKAFSRPSSLRIHSHSHTGEKPFKCPHAGCGKAFSVRSNMKRHERGCHATTSSAITAS